MERQSQGSWHRAVPSWEESVSLSFCWLMTLWSRILIKREVGSRKWEVSQGRKANPFENLGHFLLFLGPVLLCLMCRMSTTMSANTEKRVFLWINIWEQVQRGKGHERWKRKKTCLCCSSMGGKFRTAGTAEGLFLGEDEGQLSISLCKLRNYMLPSDSACASGLRGTSWDVSLCLSSTSSKWRQ